MAKQNQGKSDLGELIQRSDAARASLSQSSTKLKQKLNLASRAKDSIKKEPAKAIGGSLLAGLLLKKILFRKKKTPLKQFKQKQQVAQLKKTVACCLAFLPCSEPQQNLPSKCMPPSSSKIT